LALPWAGLYTWRPLVALPLPLPLLHLQSQLPFALPLVCHSKSVQTLYAHQVLPSRFCITFAYNAISVCLSLATTTAPLMGFFYPIIFSLCALVDVFYCGFIVE